MEKVKDLPYMFRLIEGAFGWKKGKASSLTFYEIFDYFQTALVLIGPDSVRLYYSAEEERKQTKQKNIIRKVKELKKETGKDKLNLREVVGRLGN